MTSTRQRSAPARVLAAGPRLAAREVDRRRQRRRTRRLRAVVVAAMLVPLVLAGWLLLASRLLALSELEVSGQSRVTRDEVVAAVGIAPGTPLARIDTAAVARRVGALAPVARVQVTRSWPHVLRVVVTERVAVAAVADGKRVLLLDVTGAVIGPAATPGPHVVPLRVPAVDGPAARAALAVLGALPARLRNQLAALTATGPDQVQLELRDGRKVEWGSPSASAQKARATLALLALPGRVYDVSAPGVVTRR